MVGKFSDATYLLGFFDDIQGAYINQLMLGATPAENIFLPGYPANYYWLFHAHIAALSAIAKLNPLLVLAAFNVVAVFSALLWLGRVLTELGLARQGTLFLGFAVLLVYFSVNLSGILSALAHLLDGAQLSAIGEIDAMRLLNLPGADPRLHGVWGKVIGGSGSMAIGMTCFCAALYACLRIVKGDSDRKALVLLSASGIAALAVQQVIAFCIVILGAGALLLAAKDRSWLPWQSGGLSRRWLCGWLIISLALSLPLLHYIQAAAAYSPHSISLRFPPWSAVAATLAAIVLLLPFVALELRYALRAGGRTRLYLLVCAALLSIAGFTIFLEGNEYKFVYALAIVMTLGALFALRQLGASANRGWRIISAILFATLAALACSNTAWVNMVLATNQKHNFYLDGKHLSLADFNSPRAAAYYWIRRNTPGDAIVVMPSNAVMFDPLIMERMPYVKLSQAHLGDSIPAHDRRLRLVERFYDPTTSVADYNLMLSHMQAELPGRALYAVVTDKQLSQQIMAERGAELVMPHGRGGFNVYWLNPD